MKRKNPPLVNGQLTGRRTEADYLGVLLDAVTLEEWREVVKTTLAAAKAGDPGARAWLAQFLIGKPSVVSPTPLSVVVQQLSGLDPVVEALAKPHIDREEFPILHVNETDRDAVRAQVREELRRLGVRASSARDTRRTAGAASNTLELPEESVVQQPDDFGKN